MRRSLGICVFWSFRVTSVGAPSLRSASPPVPRATSAGGASRAPFHVGPLQTPPIPVLSSIPPAFLVAFQCAAEFGAVKVVQFLVENTKADVNATN